MMDKTQDAKGTDKSGAKEATSASQPGTSPAPKKQETVKKAKSVPDASKLLNARPTRIPRTFVRRSAPILPELKFDINWRLIWCLVGALVLIPLVIYFHAPLNALVFNDFYNLVDLKFVQDWQEFWVNLAWHGLTQPLQQPWLRATFGMDAQSSFMSVPWYHFANILLHIGTAIYLFVLIFRLSMFLKADDRLDVDPYQIAFAPALLFLCHPLLVEPVAYVSAREGPLLAANYILALNAFLFAFLAKKVRPMLIGYTFAFLFTAMAMTTSVVGVTVPMTMIVTACILKPPAETWKEWFIVRGVDYILLAMMSIILPLISITGVSLLVSNGMGLPTLSGGVFLASQLKALVTYYARCLLVPVGMTVDPPHVVASGMADPLALLGAVVLTGVVAAAWIWRARPFVVLGLFIFLSGFVPASLVVQPEVASDRRFYLPVLGICIVVGWLLSRLASRSFKMAAALFSAVIVAYCGLTIWTVLNWETNLSLWQHAVKMNGKSARAHSMLALTCVQSGKYDQALSEANRALELDPDNVMAIRVLAIKDQQEGKSAEARDKFEKAYALVEKQNLQPQLKAEVQRGLAKNLMDLGDLKRAKALAEDALKVLPYNAQLHLIVGKGLIAEKQPIRALMELHRAFREDQYNPELVEPMMIAYMDSGVPSMSEQAYNLGANSMLVMQGDSTRLLMARAALETGRYSLGQELLHDLLKKDAKNAAAMYYLSLLARHMSDFETELKWKRLAEAIDPKIAEKVKLTLHNKAGDEPAGNHGGNNAPGSPSSTQTENKPPAPVSDVPAGGQPAAPGASTR